MVANTLSARQRSVLKDRARDVVTPEARAHYAELGWWVSPPFLDDAVISAAEVGAERIHRGEHDRRLTDGRTRFGWTAADGDVLRKNDYASLLVDELAHLTTSPLLGAVAAALSGADSIRLWHDQLLHKPAMAPGQDPGHVGWHTDRQYWLTATSTSMLTAWVPFHDITEAHGPVMFVDGSHRWDGVVGDFWNVDLEAGLAATVGGRPVSLSSALVPRGGASFHHCRTVHGSGPNRSGEPRRAIAVHLQDGANAYAGDTDADGAPISHSLVHLCRRLPDGRPDFADPQVCPTLWE